MFAIIGLVVIVGVTFGIITSSTSSNTNSPEGVTTAALANIISGNHGALCKDFVPKDQARCRSGRRIAATGTFVVGTSEIHGNKALVPIDARL